MNANLLITIQFICSFYLILYNWVNKNIYKINLIENKSENKKFIFLFVIIIIFNSNFDCSI